MFRSRTPRDLAQRAPLRALQWLLVALVTLVAGPAWAMAPLCDAAGASMPAPIPVLPVTGAEANALPCDEAQLETVTPAAPSPEKAELRVDACQDHGVLLAAAPLRRCAPIELWLEPPSAPAQRRVEGAVYRPPRV